MCEETYKMDFTIWPDGTQVVVRQRLTAGQILSGIKPVEKIR